MSSIMEKARELARVYFDLELPVTEVALKKAYKQKARELHPDLGGDEEAFKDLQKAYNFFTSDLARLSGVFSEGEGELIVLQTVEGIPLAELGLGLGPTTNGKDCPKCDHKGYIKDYGHSWHRCEHCDDDGMVPREFKCKRCNGTGTFFTAQGREVDCRTCRGTGIFKHPYLSKPCSVCHGSKTVWSQTEQVFYRKCSHCNGTGELEIFNPVVPKGAIAGLVS